MVVLFVWYAGECAVVLGFIPPRELVAVGTLRAVSVRSVVVFSGHGTPCPYGIVFFENILEIYGEW